MSHFSVLNHLVRLGDGRTPLSIAEAFQVSKGTMTNTLSVLSGRGFVALEPNPEDGRSKLVRLTGAGRTFHAEAIASLDGVMERLRELLDVEAVLGATPALVALRETLDENRDL